MKFVFAIFLFAALFFSFAPPAGAVDACKTGVGAGTCTCTGAAGAGTLTDSCASVAGPTSSTIYTCGPSVGGLECKTLGASPCECTIKKTVCQDPTKPPLAPSSILVWTALGCIDPKPENFVGWILSNAIKVAGALAFLLMLLGTSKIIASGGNPEAIAGGKEIITSAVTGLLLIIFAAVILRFIGVDILKIPGFS